MRGRWVLATDGAARGNPGPAGAGGTLCDPQGRLVGQFGVALGSLTNNEAEYRALLLGLELASRQGAARLEVRLDSELVVRHLSGAYRVRAGNLRPLFEEARRRIAAFEACEVRHVPREQNAAADRLANAGIDGGAPGGTY